jgi:hypothetical protein
LERSFLAQSGDGSGGRLREMEEKRSADALPNGLAVVL